MVLGSCLKFNYVTNCFIFYFAVFDSDSIHNLYYKGSSNLCLMGPGTCKPCNHSAYFDYLDSSGCISTVNSRSKDANGSSCVGPNPCRDNIDLKCLCFNSSCYYNSSTLIQCIDIETGNLTETAKSCSQIGQGCCSSMCLECRDENTCLSCVANNSFVDKDGLCTCSDGFYGNRPLASKSSCFSCSSECLKCISSINCTSCIAENASPSTAGCACDVGYFSTGPLNTQDSCQKCSIFCLQCENASLCNKCAFDLEVNNGKCSCSESFWLDFTERFYNPCKPCNENCKSCLNPETCLGCISLFAEPSRTGCVCLSGYWNSTQLVHQDSCRSCHSDCSSCSGPDGCTECRDQNAFLFNQTCMCKDGFWERRESQGMQCLKCFDRCKTCLNATFCLSCEDGTKNFHGLCPAPCSRDCEVCLFNGTCVKCKDKNAGFNQNTKTCQCLVGFFLQHKENHFCESCPQFCEFCLDKQKFKICSFGAELINGSCMCMKGYQESGLQCEKSYFFLNTSISRSNNLILKFSEVLKFDLKYSNVSISIETKSSFNYKIFKKSKNSFLVILSFKESISNGTLLRLNLQPFPILSLSYSELDLYSYNLTLNQFDYIEPWLDSLIEITNSLSQGAVISSAASSFVNPYSLWLLLNTLQILTYLPLSSAEMTPAMKKMSQKVMEIQFYPNYLLLAMDNHKDTNLTPQMIDCGLNSTVFWVNSSYSLMFLLTFLLLWPLIYGLSKVNILFIKRRFEKITQSYKFCFFIRFWIQVYLEFCIFAIIQLSAVKSIDQINRDRLLCFNYASAMIILVISNQVLTSLTPLAIFAFMCKFREKIKNQDTEFILKFKTLFDGLKTTSGLAELYFYSLFTARRLGFVLFQVLLNDFHYLQMSLNCFLSLTCIAYLVKFRPFLERLNLMCNILSEVTIFLCSFCVLLNLRYDQKHEENILEKTFCFAVLGFLISSALVVLFKLLQYIRSVLERFILAKVEKSKKTQGNIT